MHPVRGGRVHRPRAVGRDRGSDAPPVPRVLRSLRPLPRARSQGRRGGGWLAPFLIGRTHFGGAFLLLPAALALSRVAERTLTRALGSAEKARRLALSLFFRAVLGIERVFLRHPDPFAANEFI